MFIHLFRTILLGSLILIFTMSVTSAQGEVAACTDQCAKVRGWTKAQCAIDFDLPVCGGSSSCEIQIQQGLDNCISQAEKVYDQCALLCTN